MFHGHDLLDHVTRDSICLPKYVLTPDMGVTKEINNACKVWVKTNMDLLSLLLTTLSDDAIEHVVGCKIAYDICIALQDRYMSVSNANVNHLKAMLHTIQRGRDTVDK